MTLKLAASALAIAAVSALRFLGAKSYLVASSLLLVGFDGRLIEGNGVMPDIVVRRTRAQLVADEDAVLAAAAARLAR